MRTKPSRLRESRREVFAPFVPLAPFVVVVVLFILAKFDLCIKSFEVSKIERKRYVYEDELFLESLSASFVCNPSGDVTLRAILQKGDGYERVLSM